jgi:hypothetical protein
VPEKYIYVSAVKTKAPATTGATRPSPGRDCPDDDRLEAPFMDLMANQLGTVVAIDPVRKQHLGELVNCPNCSGPNVLRF